MSMEIPDAVFWGSVATVASALVGYIVRVEGRLNERITRAEHQQICDRSNDVLNRKLDDVRGMLEESREDRRRLRELMQIVATEVSVMRGRALQLRELEEPDRDKL